MCLHCEPELEKYLSDRLQSGEMSSGNTKPKVTMGYWSLSVL